MYALHTQLLLYIIANTNNNTQSYQRPTVPLREYDPAAHAEGSVISSVIHPVTSAFTGNRRISVGHRQHRSLYYPLTSNFSCGASDTCASPFAPAIAASGDKIFITGNWIFATSTDAGSTWSIGDPFSNMDGSLLPPPPQRGNLFFFLLMSNVQISVAIKMWCILLMRIGSSGGDKDTSIPLLLIRIETF